MRLPKLRARNRAPATRASDFRVVAHRPWLRLLASTLVAGVVVAAAWFGYRLGLAKGELDGQHFDTLEVRERAQRSRIDSLERQLADARLAQAVDAQAAQSLRATISELRDRVAGLREEVTFYKSLMAPSSIERGLQIAEFELSPGGEDNQFAYHLLLTQAEERRSWIQGSVVLEIHGVRAATDGSSVEEVLPLTELAEVDEYPLRFRFRYFQDLVGVVVLPEGFRPRAVQVTATPNGGAAPAERRFDWLVQPG